MSAVEIEAKPEAKLNALDRCDFKECGAQAYVLVRGISGELLFCAHHYAEASGEKLEAFAFETIDERNRLNIDRLVD